MSRFPVASKETSLGGSQKTSSSKPVITDLQQPQPPSTTSNSDRTKSPDQQAVSHQSTCTTNSDSTDNSAASAVNKTEMSSSSSVSSSSHRNSTVDENSKTQNDQDESSPSDRVYQAEADCYNGSVGDNYKWSQTISDVDIRIKLPPQVRSGRQLDVVITDEKRLQVKLLTPIAKEDTDRSASTLEPLIFFFDRQLSWAVKKAEIVWTVQLDEKVLLVSLEKVQERWWESAFDGDDKINTRAIDCSRPMHELDEGAQAKIQQLMFDQRQKRLGLPTSQQQKVHDILEQAWDQEGSPFRGTPFDPTKVNIDASNLSS